MNFRAEFTPKPFTTSIKHQDKIMLIGSCFTEQIGNKIAAHKFETLQNPNGILFNPFSIAKAICSYVDGKLYTKNNLFYYNELWASKEHHTRFSAMDVHQTLQNINIEQQAAIGFVKQADWILITLGSAFVYEWKDEEANETYANVAANCHKIPTDKFNKRLTSVTEISLVLRQMQQKVWQINAAAKFIYTISPVRHLRDGFVENNQSKAALIQAVHSLTNEQNVYYFPAYELVIDDLRDYRFYAEDLTHPNYAATNYVWEKFIKTVFNEPTQALLVKINDINAAMSHKPFNPASNAHQLFLKQYLQKIQQIQINNSCINFTNELVYFKGNAIE